MREDIMVDIETLGKDSDSTIIQIAAVIFDIETGRTYREFCECADISKEDIKVKGDTLKWWLNTDKELFTTLLNKGTISPSDLVCKFKVWLEDAPSLKKESVYLWGNGILFDNHFLKDQMEELYLDYPIFYKNDRDLRTLLDMACSKLKITPKEFQKMHEDIALTKHNALDDVKYQIKIACECYKILMGKE